jgi:hypothetical protein
MKNKWVYIIFLILVAIALSVYFTNRTGTIKKELRDFAVEDTASVTKIFMVDKQNNKITLDRKSASSWTVNNKYYARPDAIKTLLETIASVDIQSPVAKSSLPNVIKRLATQSVKVEIYKNSELLKVYYVGGATQSSTGTYMVLENSSVPFVTEIPGFSGYLTGRYFIDEVLWRDNSIFLYSFNDIASVDVKITAKPEKSYTIFNDGKNNFTLKDYQNNAITDFDLKTVKEYVAGFKKVKCESFVNEFFSKSRLDSLLKTSPIGSLSVTDRKGQKNTLKLYYRPNISGANDDNGKTLPFDPDAMYGVLQGDKDVVVCQYFVFDPLMKEIKYFLKKSPV